MFCREEATPLARRPFVEQDHAEAGSVIVAGAEPHRRHEKYFCPACHTYFDTRHGFYVRLHDPYPCTFGVAVWPAARKRTVIEWTGDNWMALIEGQGSMLLDTETSGCAMGWVFSTMSFSQREKWAADRGIKMHQEEDDEHFSVRIEEGVLLFHLFMLKEWWRLLGSRPVPKAIALLSRRGYPPIWLPGRLDLNLGQPRT